VQIISIDTFDENVFPTDENVFPTDENVLTTEEIVRIPGCKAFCCKDRT
jgi:hypothetical protein